MKALSPSLLHPLRLLPAMLLTAGAILASAEPTPAAPAPPEPSGQPAAGHDLYGGPLPPGALGRLGTLRFRAMSGHLAVTPDGKTVVAADYSGHVVRVFDAATGELRRTFQAPGPPTEIPASSILSPDGKYLSIQGEPFGRTVWDVEAGKLVHNFGDNDISWPAAFSTDGRTLALVDSNRQCRLLDLAAGKVRDLGALDSPANELAISPDGKRLVLSVVDNTVRCWETGEGKELWRAAAQFPRSLAFSPDGTLLTAGSAGQPLLLDAATGKPLGRVRLPPGKEGHWYACASSKDTLAVLLGDRVLLWDLEKKAVRGSVTDTGANRQCYAMAFSPDGKSLYTVGALLQRWEVATGKPLYPDPGREGHTSGVLAVTFSPDGRRLASAAQEGTVTVRVWDVAGRRLLHKLPGHGTFPNAFLHFTPDGILLACGGDGVVHAWDGEGKEQRHWELWDPKEKRQEPSLSDLHLADDGRTLLALSLYPSNGPFNGCPGTIGLWDSTTGKRLRSWPDVRPLYNSAVRPDGRAVVLETGEVIDTRTGTRRRTVPYEKGEGGGPTPAFVFSPDGALLAGREWMRFEKNRVHKPRQVAIPIWEAATGKLLVRLETDDELDDGCRLTFTPDGHRLLTIGPETIRLWDFLRGGKEVFRRAVPGRLLNAWGGPITFSPDGRVLATGHPDTTVLLWELPAAERPAEANDEAMRRWWADLAADDPRKGYSAFLELAARPGPAVALLQERLRPAVAVPAADVKGWIADLDSPIFARREEAARRLGERGLQVEPALRQVLAQTPPLETRKRIEALLEAAQAPRGEDLRGVRAVGLLRRMGSAEARDLLEKLGKGDPAARLTREATAALRGAAE